MKVIDAFLHALLISATRSDLLSIRFILIEQSILAVFPVLKEWRFSKQYVHAGCLKKSHGLRRLFGHRCALLEGILDSAAMYLFEYSFAQPLWW